MSATIPAIPVDAPFSDRQRDWLNGFLAGLFSSDSQNGVVAIKPDLGKLTFLFGTQTGTSEMLAQLYAKKGKKQGFTTEVKGLEDYESLDLATLERVLIITSTYGEGDMPDNAQAFWDFLNSEEAPDLSHLGFSVLALGDSSYTEFCKAGKDLDARLEQLGARRIHPRVDCDVDYEEPAAEWFKGVTGELTGHATPAAGGAEDDDEAEEVIVPGAKKSHPFEARLLEARLLSGPGSLKEVRHVAISLEGAQWNYEAGDCLGVFPQNCPELVAEVLDAAGLDGDLEVDFDGVSLPLRQILLDRVDLGPCHDEIPSGLEPAEFLKPLKKMQPRLYSISSSPRANEGQVHLTIGVVRYPHGTRTRKGVCSTYLAEHAARGLNGQPVRVFLHRSPHFRLPTNPETPVIMVGPGTGIAPFRAFLQERRSLGSPGRNWLFFGDQTSAHDFHYREELEEFREQGFCRLSLAFSRDQEEKIYVQHRMLEEAGELWQWFEDGACLYVCGDAHRMAKDVDLALHEIAEKQGGMNAGEAATWVAGLKKEKRYLRDVY